MGIFDKPELQCAAGTGLAILGLPWAAPLAADACVEVVKKAVDVVEESTYRNLEALRQNYCESRNSFSPWDFLLGMASPVTAIAMRYPDFACSEKSFDSLEFVKDSLSEILPFAVGGVAGLGASTMLKIVRGEESHRLIEGLAKGMLRAIAMKGTLRTFHRLHEVPLKFSADQLKAIKTDTHPQPKK